MTATLCDPEPDAVPLEPLRPTGLDAWRTAHPQHAAWLEATGFAAKTGETCLLPGASGGLARVLAGLGDDPDPVHGDLWGWAGIAQALPGGIYALETAAAVDPARVALGWGLADYRFGRFRIVTPPTARLCWPAGCDRAAVTRALDATTLVRDLINRPAGDLGPARLAEAAAGLADSFGAALRVVVGDDLLTEDYPAIHAVGRAAAEAPRLIDLSWGDPGAPRLTLVGKGVCFDTGGLGLKPAEFMKTMKKDMGGAAHVLGLARMIMDAGLPVRLRVLIPAVENSVAGNAIRPLDVIRTRSGKTVEIGHTDAEGRVILADALTEACRESPDLLIDCATLTGAARVALGTDLPALFSNDDAVAGALLDAAAAAADPLWRLPLWLPYRRQIEGKTADLTNDAESRHGGALTAALFLREFVTPEVPWIHVDMMAWNTTSRPGRPEGGEAQGMRALFGMLSARYEAC